MKRRTFAVAALVLWAFSSAALGEQLKLDSQARAALSVAKRTEGVQKYGLRRMALRAEFVRKHRNSYRVQTPIARQSLAVRDQASSGRCWLFAAATVLSNKVAKKSGTAPELSTAYWNYHALRKRAFALIDAQVGAKKKLQKKAKDLGEGGEFPFAMELVAEVGGVPESAMPSNTFDSQNSGVMLSVLKQRLAVALDRIAALPEADVMQRRRMAKEQKKELELMLGVTLGTPPTEFSVDGRRFTPKTYLRDHLKLGGDDLRYVPLFSRPHLEGELKETKDELDAFTSFNARLIKPRQMRKLAQQALDHGEALYFATNVGANNPHRVEDKIVAQEKRGILSVGAFDYKSYVSASLLPKRDRVDLGIDSSNHGMVFTGYDTRGKSRNVRKWRVDNSWGSKRLDDGRFHMYNDYFGAYVEKLFVPLSALTPAQREKFVVP